MRTFTGNEEYYVLMLIPFGSKEHGYAPRYWAKGRDFALKEITGRDYEEAALAYQRQVTVK